MLLTCPNCATFYQIATSAIGAKGRSVRCVRCQKVWYVPATAAQPAVATGDAAPAEPATEAAAAPPVAPDPGPGQPATLAEPAEAAPSDTPAEPSLDDMIAAQPQDEAPGADAEPSAAETAGEPPHTMALSDIPIPMEASPPLVPEPGEGALPPAPGKAIDNGAEDIESVAQRRRARNAARRRKSKLRVPIAAVIGVLLIACGAVIGLRKDVVRHAPQMASFYASIGLPVNLRGVVFSDLKVASETHDGVPVLVVEGNIVSTASMPVDVPRLRFALRNAAGAEVYAWTAQPSESVIEPGERLPFRSRLASPPQEGQNVQVRFFTHRDAVAAGR